MMSKNLRKCLKTMQLYCCSKSNKLKKSILNDMSKQKCFFDCLFEIVNNIKQQKIKLTTAQRGKLKKQAKLLYKIHRKPRSHNSRVRLVNQSGGFIQYILPVVAPIVVELIANAISKKNNTNS